MPNYVKNEITFTGEKETVKKFLSQFESENNPFDFDKIIPIPASFYENCDINGKLYESGSNSEKALRDFIHGDYSNALGSQMAANIIKYNAKDWYEFCNKYWGTKWNSLDTEMHETSDGFKFYFETAWCMPDKIYEAILKKIEEEKLNITVFAEWSNEDWCQNSGELRSEISTLGENSYGFCYTYDSTDSENAARYIELWYDGNAEDAGFFKDESGNYISYVDFKAGYYEFNVFLGDEVIYTFDDGGLSEKITDETDSERLADIVDDCIDVMKEDFKSSDKEFPFNNAALAVLKNKMMNGFAEHFCIKI